MPRNISSSKTWVFTLNNYTQDEYSAICSKLSSSCSYAIVGKEVGSNGTPHLQGYLRSRTQLDCARLKQDLLNSRCHVEKARGAAGVNRQYCSKDGDYWESGKCPGVKVGKSRDELATEFVSRMAGGADGLRTFADDNPGTYLFSGHNMLRNYLRCQPAISRPDVSVEWHWGPPGAGKSRYAHEQLPNAYIKDPRTKWWNGYQLESEVIIDDFGPNGIDINHLLRWFDRYKCFVEVKGDMIPLYATKFIVTSNFHPSSLFKIVRNYVEEEHPQLPALLRRISCTEYFN